MWEFCLLLYCAGVMSLFIAAGRASRYRGLLYGIGAAAVVVPITLVVAFGVFIMIALSGSDVHIG